MTPRRHERTSMLQSPHDSHAPDLVSRSDPLGAALIDLLHQPALPGDATIELRFDTGDVWISPVSSYFEGPESWNSIDTWLVGHVAGSVLDIGTGAGRFAVDLIGDPAVRRMVGCDASRGAVATARARGLEAHLESFPGDFSQGGIASSPWDTVMMMGNNLGLLANSTSVAAGLAKLRTIATPGAVLVGTSGLPEELPEQVRQASLERCGRPGNFRAELHYRGLVSHPFLYEFYDPQYFTSQLPGTGWTLSDVRTSSRQYGVVLQAAAA